MNLVTNNKWIGQRTIRPDGMDKVTGRAQFAADTAMPGMIWGKVLRSPHPHARIKSIDTSKAEKLPGVKAVVTAQRHRRFPDREGRGHAGHPGHALDVPQRDGARQGAVPRPPHRRRGRDHGSDRSGSLQADRGRLRGAAVVDRDRRRDQAAMRPSCTSSTSSTASRPTSPAASSTRRATSRKVSRRLTSSSSAPSPRAPFTRAISSRMPA